MTGQDNDTFEARLTLGVFEAVIEAGRTAPNSSSVEMQKTIDALCGAVASFAGTTIGLTEGVEAAASEIERQGERMAELMSFLAAKLRSGELRLPLAERPKPRLVE